MATQAKPKSATGKSTSGRKTTSASRTSGAKTAAPRKTATASKPPKGQERVKGFDGKMSNQPIALAFLMQQHREVEGYFAAYERAGGDEEKAELSRKICNALKVHAQIEEELLYPDAHEKLADEDLVDEAMVEHQSAKDMIAQIESMSVGEHLYDAKVKVLGEYIKHHVQEEEREMFPQLRKTNMDLAALAERLKARSEELMRQVEAGQPSRSRSGLLGMFRESRP